MRRQPSSFRAVIAAACLGVGVGACARTVAPKQSATAAGADQDTAPPAVRAPRPPQRPPIVYTPQRSGAKVYQGEPLRAGRDDDDLPALEAGLLKVVLAAAKDAGTTPPVPDARLHAVAADLARSSRGMRPPPSDVVRFFANHHGVIEPDPAIYTLVGPAHIPSVYEQYRRSLPRVFRRGEFNRVGVALLRRGEEITAVITLWEQHLELRPVPRRLPSEGRASLLFKLISAFAQPQLVMTLPGGHVRALPYTLTDGILRADFRCNSGDGRYQFEVLATGKAGPLVLANFPLYCGVAAPTDISAYDEDDADEIDPADAEQELLALMNQARMAAGLAALVWDNRLAAIARSHSRDMLANGFIAHVSPTTGDAVARVARAGLAFGLVLENVGQEGGVQQAHRGFMSSPGHRANVLSAKVSHVGIGVVVKRGGGAPLVVTELFAAP